MKQIACLGGKGGVGKSTVTLGLARALRDMDYKVGVMDCDFTMPDQLVMLDATKLKPKLISGCVVIPPEIEGIRILSWGMMWKEGSAIQIEDRQIDEDNLRIVLNLIKTGKSDAAIKYLQQLINSPGGATYYMRQLFDKDIVNWGDTNFLIIDTAPTTSGTIRAVAEVDLDGTVVITQPTKPSFADISRTVDMLMKKEVPIYGIVVNMAGRFESEKQSVTKFCEEQKLPLICSIPFLKPDSPKLKEHFTAIANYILSNDPIILKQEEQSEEWEVTLKEFGKAIKILDIFRG